MVMTFDYTVSPRIDDFGPFTTGTLTAGLQEALSAAGSGGSVFVRSGSYTLHRPVAQKGNNQLLFCEPGVTFLAASDFDDPINAGQGMFSLGTDGTTDYDGFVFQGNGCLIDGQNVWNTVTRKSSGGIVVNGFEREVWNFVVRDFRAKDFPLSYGVSIGRGNLGSPNSLNTLATRVGNVLIENFDIANAGWIRVWQAEQVVARSGRCRGLHSSPEPGLLTNGLFLTSQKSAGTAQHVSRFIRFEDVDCNSNVTDMGGSAGDSVIEAQGAVSSADNDQSYDVEFIRCRIRTNAGAESPSGGIYIDDADSSSSSSGLMESVYFRDCVLDGPIILRRVLNSTPGYVVLDHCQFLNSSAFDVAGSSFAGGGSYETRPYVIARAYGTITLPNQSFVRTPGASPWTYTNSMRHTMLVVVSGGTVSSLSVQPRGGAALTTGETAGAFYLGPGDAIVVTYTSPPSFTVAPFEE